MNFNSPTMFVKVEAQAMGTTVCVTYPFPADEGQVEERILQLKANVDKALELINLSKVTSDYPGDGMRRLTDEDAEEAPAAEKPQEVGRAPAVKTPPTPLTIVEEAPAVREKAPPKKKAARKKKVASIGAKIQEVRAEKKANERQYKVNYTDEDNICALSVEFSGLFVKELEDKHGADYVAKLSPDELDALEVTSLNKAFGTTYSSWDELSEESWRELDIRVIPDMLKNNS